mgnify:CR=1 FL=1
MRDTGIVREVDYLGRLEIPKELRNKKGVNDSYKFFVEGEDIIIREYDPGCMFCGSVDDNLEYQDITICKKCYGNIDRKKRTKWSYSTY